MTLRAYAVPQPGGTPVPPCHDNAARVHKRSLCEFTTGSTPFPPEALSNEPFSSLSASAPKGRRPPSRAPLARSPRRTISLPARSARFALSATRVHLAPRRRRRAPLGDSGPLQARWACYAPVRASKDIFASRAARATHLASAVALQRLKCASACQFSCVFATLCVILDAPPVMWRSRGALQPRQRPRQPRRLFGEPEGSPCAARWGCPSFAV